MACAFIGAAIDHFLTPPLPIAHAITLRTNPPPGHPNTTLLGFRVALSRRAGSWPFFLPSRVPIDCIAAFPSPVPRYGRQTKRHMHNKETYARKADKCKKKARPQRRRLGKGLRPSRRKKGHVERNAHGSGHLGFANRVWPPDRSAATKICGTESVLLAVAERQFCPTGAPSGLLKASLCYGKPAVVPTPQD